MENPPPLLHADLIAPSRPCNHVLMPNEIPVHPSVIESKIVFDPAFIGSVLDLIPLSMSKDDEAIEKILGVRAPWLITESSIVYTHDREKKQVREDTRVHFIDFSFHSDPDLGFLILAYKHSSQPELMPSEGDCAYMILSRGYILQERFRSFERISQTDAQDHSAYSHERLFKPHFLHKPDLKASPIPKDKLEHYLVNSEGPKPRRPMRHPLDNPDSDDTPPPTKIPTWEFCGAVKQESYARPRRSYSIWDRYESELSYSQRSKPVLLTITQYFRNFAIVFNNCALRELENNK